MLTGHKISLNRARFRNCPWSKSFPCLAESWFKIGTMYCTSLSFFSCRSFWLQLVLASIILMKEKYPLKPIVLQIAASDRAQGTNNLRELIRKLFLSKTDQYCLELGVEFSPPFHFYIQNPLGGTTSLNQPNHY